MTEIQPPHPTPKHLASAAAKEPFDIDRAMQLAASAVAHAPAPALFQLYDRGYKTPFEQLIACLISIRTLDEHTLPLAQRLFTKAHTPAQILALSVQDIAALIRPATFYLAKAERIHAIAREVEERYGGQLPCDEAIMRSFSGVGPKCANLVLTVACGVPRIAVDVHVHRVVNRWGYVSARTPEETLSQLTSRLPKRHWISANRVLMPFGKHVCTGKAPRCSICPLLSMCRQVGVTTHR